MWGVDETSLPVNESPSILIGTGECITLFSWLCVSLKFSTISFFQVYYHILAVGSGSSRSGRKWIGLRDNGKVKITTPKGTNDPHRPTLLKCHAESQVFTYGSPLQNSDLF